MSDDGKGVMGRLVSTHHSSLITINMLKFLSGNSTPGFII
jgi:hypothetical protein